MNELVSIIIPIYNAELYLEECIDSILKQSYKKFELILVNDGSNDQSGNICEKYVQIDERVCYVLKDNSGVSDTRNIGLQKASGEFIAFCDADDVYDRLYLEKMVAKLCNDENDMVICNYAYTESRENAISKRSTGKIEKLEIYRSIFTDSTIGGFIWNKMFKRKILENIKFESSLDICEDTYFVCCALKKIEKVFYLQDVLYFYRLRDNSTIGNIENIFDINGNMKYYLVFERIIKEKLIPDNCIKYVKANECLFAIGVKCDYLNAIDKKEKKYLIKLNNVIKRTLLYLLKSREYSCKKKIIAIGNLMFNLRRIKKKYMTETN